MGNAGRYWAQDADDEDTLRVLRHRAPLTRDLPPIFESRFVAELTEPRVEPPPPPPPSGLKWVLKWLTGK